MEIPRLGLVILTTGDFPHGVGLEEASGWTRTNSHHGWVPLQGRVGVCD